MPVFDHHTIYFPRHLFPIGNDMWISPFFAEDPASHAFRRCNNDTFHRERIRKFASVFSNVTSSLRAARKFLLHLRPSPKPKKLEVLLIRFGGSVNSSVLRNTPIILQSSQAILIGPLLGEAQTERRHGEDSHFPVAPHTTARRTPKKPIPHENNSA